MTNKREQTLGPKKSNGLVKFGHRLPPLGSLEKGLGWPALGGSTGRLKMEKAGAKALDCVEDTEKRRDAKCKAQNARVPVIADEQELEDEELDEELGETEVRLLMLLSLLTLVYSLSWCTADSPQLLGLLAAGGAAGGRGPVLFQGPPFMMLGTTARATTAGPRLRFLFGAFFIIGADGTAAAARDGAR